MDLGNGKLQLPIPDLGAIAQQQQQVDPALWVQHHICTGAGIEPGGRARVNAGPASIVLDKFELIVMALPAALVIVCVKGIDTEVGQEGTPVTIPWHAVRSIGPA